MIGQKILLTRDGYEELKKELHELQTVQLPEVLRNLQEARSMGDLSENGMYTAMREKQGQVQGRIFEVEDIIKNAQVAETPIDNGGSKAVSLGSKVKLESQKQTVEYSVVGTEEVDSLAGKISHESPLGQALLGREIGEIIEVNAPMGVIKYKIIDIK